MKRVVSVLLMLGLLFSFALAEGTDYEALLEEKDARIAELEARVAELEAQLEEKTPAYPTLENGSKGQDVQKLQERLKSLGYLDGSADGVYGNGTAGAVSAFQSAVGLDANGIADEGTQTALFADDAPRALVYVDLDYTENARNPESYAGTMIKFSGNILQVMEDDDYVVFRISSDGNYDDVVYCVYEKPENYTRFLEDDKVNVWGVSDGVYSYTTIMGGEMTIPSCIIDRIELR